MKSQRTMKHAKLGNKALSVLLSLVLVVGFTPIQAWADPAGSDAAAEPASTEAASPAAPSANAADAQQAAPEAEHTVTPVIDEGDASGADDMGAAEEAAAAEGAQDVEPDMTASAEAVTLNRTDANGKEYWIVYEPYSDDEISGYIITHVGMGHYTSDVDIVIPAEIDDVPVVGIGYDYVNGFSWSASYNAKTITIPASVQFMHNIYFNSAGYGGVYFEAGSPITELYPETFKGYQASSVTLPDGLVAIYDNMFEQSKIESIVLPSATREIGKQAFRYASKLTSVTLNNGLEVIGKEAFAHVPGSGFDGYQGGYYYGDYGHITELAIPNSVKEIDEAAFRKVETLTSLSLGTNPASSNLEYIGPKAFYAAPLTNVVIPDSVVEIGAEAFADDPYGAGWDPTDTRDHTITNLQFGSSQNTSQLTVLGARAFAGQPITSITLPNSLRLLGSDDEGHGFLFNGNHTNTHLTAKKYYIDDPDALARFDDYLFQTDVGNGSMLQSKGAFSGCDQLKTIVWPTQPGLSHVGGFDYCTSLTDEAIESLPNWVTTIDDYGFYNCTGFSDVAIPATVVHIGKGAFGMNKATTIDGTAPSYHIQNRVTTIVWEDDATLGPQGPWPVGRGYTIYYPASTPANADIVKYREAVEAYEQVQGQNNSSYKYTQFVEVPDTVNYDVNVAIPASATARLYVDGLDEGAFEGTPVTASVAEGKSVAVLVSLDGYANYTARPNVGTEDEGILTGNWTATVAEADMTPIADTGQIYVTLSKSGGTENEARIAAIGCHVAIFDATGRRVAQGLASTASTFMADGLPAGTYKVVAYDKNDLFTSISSEADLLRLGVASGTWATATVNVSVGNTSELALEVPDLQIASAEDVLASGGVVVTNGRLVPDYVFYVRVNYVMKDGREATSLTVNIPAGMEPVNASTNKASYGLDGYNESEGTLAVNLNQADRQKGTLYVGCKVTTPGSYNVSASVASAAGTVPLGSASIDAPALKLLMPASEVSGDSVDVDVYAAPGTTVRFLVGGESIDAVAVTNKAGHGKATLAVPEDVMSAAAVNGELAVSAYIGADFENATASDVQAVTYRGPWNVDEGYLEWELSFKHAGQTVYLSKDGKFQRAVGYTVVKASHSAGKANSTTWPFTYVALSDKPLADHALLGLKMLDGSDVCFAEDEGLQLVSAEDVGNGVVRYTYTANIPIGPKDGSDYGLSDIPYGFSVVPLYVEEENSPKVTTFTHEEFEKLTAGYPTSEEEWWDQTVEKYLELAQGEELNPDNEKSTLDFIFNSSYHHENWGRTAFWDDLSDEERAAWSQVWDEMDAEQREKIVQFEEGLDELCLAWQQVYNTTRPLNEYTDLEQYMQENYNYQDDFAADPATLASQGYQVIYDGDDWYAMRYTSYEEDEEDPDMQGTSEEDVMTAQTGGDPNGSGTQGKKGKGKIEIANSKGVKAEKEIGYFDGFFSWENAISQLDAAAGVAIAYFKENPPTNLLQKLGVTASQWDDFCKYGSKALGWIGSFLGLVQWVEGLADSDGADFALTKDHINYVKKRLNNEMRYYESIGATDTRCYRAMVEEMRRWNAYRKELNWSYATYMANSVVNGEMFGLSVVGTSEKLAAKVAAPAAMSTAKGTAAVAGTGLGSSMLLSAGNAAVKNDLNEAKRLAINMHAWTDFLCQRGPDPHSKAAVFIDPSGYVFEGVEGEWAEGVTATIYYQDEGGAWVEWDAAEYDMVNPQVISENGMFAWDTPPGKWKVVFTADGYDAAVVDLDGPDAAYEYETQAAAETPSMDVPPEWTNIMVGLLPSAAPAVASMAASANGKTVTITFDQYMDTSAAITVTIDGKAVTATWGDAVDGINSAGGAAKLTKSLTVPVPAGAKPGSTLKVAVSAGKGLSGKPVASTTKDVKLPGVYKIDIAGATVSAIADQTYTGKAIRPAITVKAEGATLKEGTDYTIAYRNNTNAGTASITITGKGKCQGTKKVTFKIKPAAITSVTVADQTYTGKALTPVPVVKAGSLTVPASGYTVTYKNNVEAGKATVAVAGKGNFTGLRAAYFTITKPSAPSKPTKTGATNWKRLWGDTALDTMSRIVDEGAFPKGGAVVLTTSGGYWDALTAAGVAGLAGAPVLMTDGEELSPQTREQIAKLAPKTVIVCGGTAAVTGDVVDEALAAAGSGARYVRLAGDTAIGTAEKIFASGGSLAQSGAAWSDTAFVCTSNGYWDALSAAPVSYSMHMPIFLTAPDGVIDDSTVAAMKKGGIKKVYIVGGKVAVPEDTDVALKAGGLTVAGRFAGADALETSEMVASYGLSLGLSADKMGVATVGGYWDALAGAALCGRNGSVLVLVSDEESSTISSFVKKNSPDIITGYIFGGTAAVDSATESALKAVTK